MIDAVIKDISPTVAIPVGLDAIVATHAYDGDIVSAWADRTNFSGVMVMAHTDFTPFPVRELRPGTVYTGVFPSASAPVRLRGHQYPIGLPVMPEPPPQTTPSATRDGLVIVAGAESTLAPDWMIEVGRQIAGRLSEAHVTVCLGRPSSSSVSEAPRYVDDRLQIWRPRQLTDLLAKARLVLTKPGGATTAEALAMGAVPVLLPSTIPWERKATGYLTQLGIAVAPTDTEGLIGCVERVWDDLELLKRSVRQAQPFDLGASTQRLWELLEVEGLRESRKWAVGTPEAEIVAEVLEATMANQALTDPLRRTARVIDAAMRAHYEIPNSYSRGSEPASDIPAHRTEKGSDRGG